MSKESMFVLVGAIVLLGVTTYLGVNLLVAKGKVRLTTGRIVEIMNTAGKHHLSQKVAIVGYTVNGKSYTSKNGITVFKTSRVGEEFPVRYFIDKPERLLTKNWNQFIGFLFATLAFTVIFIYLYLFQ